MPLLDPGAVACGSMGVRPALGMVPGFPYDTDRVKTAKLPDSRNQMPADATTPLVPADWGLLDAEAQHEAFPDTFPIPTLAERVALRTGDMVKLVLVLDPPPTSGPNAERMWVEVRSNQPDGTYQGWLTNRPVVITSLEPSAVVAFEARHVAGIALRKDFCRAERPTVSLFYQRRSLEK